MSTATMSQPVIEHMSVKKVKKRSLKTMLKPVFDAIGMPNNEESQRILMLAILTGIGAWGGFPNPPEALQKYFEMDAVKYLLLAILIYQGGSGQRMKLAVFVTALFYLGTYASNKYLK